MAGYVVVGTQWGDEGKGKIVDVLAEKADYVVRFQGGDNAGHTVQVNDQKFVLHLLPSGALHDQALCVIGPGVVCNPFVLLEEMKQLKKEGISVDHIIISDKAHMLLPYHRYQDELEERENGGKIGTTKRGIGPAYQDKYSRKGIRFHEFLDFDEFSRHFLNNLDFKNRLFSRVYEAKELDAKEELEKLKEIQPEIAPLIKETSHELQKALEEDKLVLFEGAQAAMLDINHGSYPFVTSSSPTSAGVCEGAGIGVQDLDHIIGVVKAYSTRVGEGPFVTELEDEMGEYLQKTGHEYGATTGRPRRCGWLDLIVVKHAREINSLTDLVLTKLDVLSGLESIPVCTGYEIDGKVYDYIPSDAALLARAKPVYEILPGWKEDICQIDSFEKLPENAQNYVSFIEEFTGVPVSMISVGPERSQNIYRNEI